MLKEDFARLPVQSIKEMLTGTDSIEFELLLWAQEDPRKTVQNLAKSYVMRQKRMLQEQQRLEKLYTYEDSYYEAGLYHVAGIDEVGRGPIAGPVTVAAVILAPHAFISGLNDSKKLSPKKREIVYEDILTKAIAVSCISYGPETIDRLNIYEATRQAMYEAVRSLKIPAEAVLVDAMPLPALTQPVESLIKGDSRSASIAAASIIAKVTRDRYMESLEADYPGFGFAVHKGYYTELHKEAIENLGITPLHRRSFEPIKSLTARLEDDRK